MRGREKEAQKSNESEIFRLLTGRKFVALKSRNLQPFFARVPAVNPTSLCLLTLNHSVALAKPILYPQDSVYPVSKPENKSCPSCVLCNNTYNPDAFCDQVKKQLHEAL